VIGGEKVYLTADQVLARLPLSSPAFSARPAREMVNGILDIIDADQLITARSSFNFHDIAQVEGSRVELTSGAVLKTETPLAELAVANSILCAAWTLGSRISTAISDAFTKRDYLRGFVLDEIASLFLYRLGENLFEQQSGRLASRCININIGKAVAPGDGLLDLSAQETILSLADAQSVGIECSASSPMSPIKSASAIAPIGQLVHTPEHRWSCEECLTSQTCRLRHAQLSEKANGRHC